MVMDLRGKWKILGVVLLACCILGAFIAVTRPQEAAPVTYPPMVNAVLAHELTDSQAKLLSEYGFAVQADVDFDPDSSWTTIYNLAKKYNLTLIGKIDYITVKDNFTLQDWTQTVQRAVDDYGDIVHVWEIWNEPTYPANFKGYFNGSFSTYADLLKVAYQIIHASSSNVTVIGFGGLQMFSSFQPDPFNTWADRGLRFARNVTALGGMDYCDVVGLHGYPWGANYTSYVQEKFVNAVSSYRQVTGKDVWVTETGQTSGEYGRNQTDKAVYLNQTYTLFQSLGVRGYVWYELNDVVGRVDSEGSFGLFDVNGSATEAFNMYVKVTK
jgi:hypothetical protein